MYISINHKSEDRKARMSTEKRDVEKQDAEK